MVRSSLTLEAAKTLVHAFVSSRLHYCNSLLYGIGDGLLTKLQTVQNVATRVVTGTRKFDHITPVLRQLHWLSVRQRITFKLAMITFKCLHGLAPSYLADVCIPVSSVVGRWQLRSTNSSFRVQGLRSVGGTLPWSSVAEWLECWTQVNFTRARGPGFDSWMDPSKNCQASGQSRGHVASG